MLNVLKTYETNGLVNLNYHPSLPLVIAKYTRACQFAAEWDDVTVQCRGLVVDVNTGQVVARPFKKFFNIEELEYKVPNEPFELYEKADGSLGIVFWYAGQWHLTTQGSFTSDEGEVGRKLLATKDLSLLDKEVTYLFEVIYNQGIVRYPYNDLVLLGAYNTQSGIEIPSKELFDTLSGTFRVAKMFDLSSDFEAIKALNWDNEEGFVVRFASGFRCKIKFIDYCEKHKQKLGLNTKVLWQALKDNKWDELVEIIPDEFDIWAKNIKDSLEMQFKEINDMVEAKYVEVQGFATRKDMAAHIKDFKWKGFVFAKLDNYNYFPDIWDKIKPEYEKAKLM